MSYQLPPLLDDVKFEELVRDIMRRVFSDPSIELFGRGGQKQQGIDVTWPANSTITGQCKLKDTRYRKDGVIRKELSKEMEEELRQTDALPKPLTRFIFASTFKNDTELQNKAALLSSSALTVEYWGWDTITERIWEFANQLILVYYPHIPIKPVHGFKQISNQFIKASRISNPDQLKELALEYYRINDRLNIVLPVVINDLDVRNTRVMEEVYRRLEQMPPSGTLWLIGDGGSGKTTTLHRVAVELALRDESVFGLDLEDQINTSDLDSILNLIKFCSPSEQTVLCIDNPAADELALKRIFREIPNYTTNVHIILSERAHRYLGLKRSGILTHLHGEEETRPIRVQNSRIQRENVYRRLFDLLGIDDADRQSLLATVRDEGLVYVNATYQILLELRRRRKIDFDFDWDDYRTSAADLPAFREGYKYIALFYLFGVKTPLATFSRICGANDGEQKIFLEKFRGFVNEPIIVDEWRDESFHKITHLRTKHEIVSDIFFNEHKDLNKDEMFMEWCEQVDFTNAVEVQALINIFGAKKNYISEKRQLNFGKILEFLLKGYLKESVSLSQKFYATLHLAQSWLALSEGNVEESIGVLRSLLDQQPSNLHCRTELARIYQQQGRLKEAELLLLTILEQNPDDIDSRTELAKLYQKQGQLTTAEQVLLEVLQIRRSDLNARTELARIYQKQGRLAEAESILRELLQFDNKNIRGRTELARVFQRDNRLTEAEKVLLPILEITPNDLNSRTELARIYQRQGKLPEAEALLLEILRRKPRDLNSRTELAKIYQRQSKLAEAETILRELLKLDIYNLPARTELAKIYQRQGKLAEAETLLLQSLEIDDRQLHPRTELARIYQRQGKLAEAETLLLQSLEIDDRQLHPRTELARIYQRQGKLAEAVQRLEEYIALDPKGLHPRIELARIYQRQEKLTQAADRAEEVLLLDPIDNFAISELLGIWTRQGEKEKCAQRFFAFIEQPTYQFSRYSQAPVFRFFQCCRKFGMKNEAMLVYERFQLQLDDRNVDFYKSTFLDE